MKTCLYAVAVVFALLIHVFFQTFVCSWLEFRCPLAVDMDGWQQIILGGTVIVCTAIILYKLDKLTKK